MAFLMTEDPRFRQGQYFIPANKFVIPADSATLTRLGGSGRI